MGQESDANPPDQRGEPLRDPDRLPANLQILRELAELRYSIAQGFAMLSERMVRSERTITGEIFKMGSSITQQITDATAAIQSDLSTMTSGVTSVAAEVTSLQSQVATLTSQVVPGAVVTQAQADALTAVAAGLKTQADALTAISAAPAA
jgi:hypothetical protein